MLHRFKELTDRQFDVSVDEDRKLLVEAMSLDPSTGTMDFGRVPELCDDLLRANRKWLPRFFD